ncbi:lachesin-like [Panulirus ornatus]|uniref:lachesin-like n=1 Tax=Panulirus ornatus TaxID=150431 RepID=UPI003A8BAA00
MKLIKMVQRPAVLSVNLAFLTIASLGGSSEDVDLPKFIENVPNITVTVGRDALLPCTVEQLKGFKVAWVQVDTQTILTIHKQVITRNPRIALLHNDHRTWHLQVKNVRESDRGWYMCQVNTDPMRSRQGYVDVVVPPDIIDRESSGDLTVREGQDVTLTCRAKGHPPPRIIWRREDNQNIILDSSKTGHGRGEGDDVAAVSGNGGAIGSSRRRVGLLGSAGGALGVDGSAAGGLSVASSGGVGVGRSVRVVEGEKLILKKVSRLQMGSYLCIASNSIPPSISKRAHLSVQFPPMTWVPQQLEGAYLGQDLTIECRTEAFPRSINYWTNTRGDMIVAGDRYEPVVAETSYKVFMKLRIRRVERQDFGTFRCVAKNSLGETDGAIRIYEIESPKAHVNGGLEDKEELPEGEELPGDPPVTPPPHKKEKTKYKNFLHPSGMNDITDQQHLGKPYGSKGSDHSGPGTRYGERPAFSLPADEGKSAARDTCPVDILLGTMTSLAIHMAFITPP